MGEIGFPELVVILVVALLVFGGKRLPEIARAMGEAIREFKQALKAGEHVKEETPQIAESNSPKT